MDEDDITEKGSSSSKPMTQVLAGSPPHTLRLRNDDQYFSTNFNFTYICIVLITQAEKRAHHNALERKRRDHIKDSFSSLRDSVPSLLGEKVRPALTSRPLSC